MKDDKREKNQVYAAMLPRANALFKINTAHAFIVTQQIPRDKSLMDD